MLPRYLIATLALALASSISHAAEPADKSWPELSFSSTLAFEDRGDDPFTAELKPDLHFGLQDADLEQSLLAHFVASPPVGPISLAWPEDIALAQDDATVFPEAGALELPGALLARISTKSISLEPALFTTQEADSALLWKAHSLSYSALKREALQLKASPPRSLQGASELSCLAVAIYHEARDQSTHGKLAVASVIQSRAQVPGRWGDDACQVVRPVQFSFMTSRYGFPSIDETQPWHDAVDMAVKSLIDGPLPELGGADHYHATYVDPDWRYKMIRIGRIGAHIFYRDPTSPHT